MLLVYAIHMLANVFIVDPIWVDLVLCTTLFQRVAMMMVAQAKEGFYRDRYHVDLFSLLAVEVFGCLH